MVRHTTLSLAISAALLLGLGSSQASAASLLLNPKYVPRDFPINGYIQLQLHIHRDKGAASAQASTPRQECIKAALVMPTVKQTFVTNRGQERRQTVRLKATYPAIPDEYSDLCRRIGRAELETKVHGEWRSLSIGWKWAWVIPSNKNIVGIADIYPNGHEPSWYFSGKKFRGVLENEVKDPNTGQVLGESTKVVPIPIRGGKHH